MHHSRQTSNRIKTHRPAFEEPVYPRPNRFVVRVEEEREQCGGSGNDCGSLSPIEPEECPACHGSGKQVVVRNYLAEALRIAAGKSAATPQREHLEAIIQHCRSLVGALMVIADTR